MFKNKCYQGGKKHRYQPVYSDVPPDPESFSKMSKEQTEALVHLFTRKLYRGHVCRWCGKGTKNP